MELGELVRIARMPQVCMVGAEGTISAEGSLSLSSHHLLWTSKGAVMLEVSWC